MKKASILISAIVILHSCAHSQNYEKIVIDTHDSLYGYYLAVRPPTNILRGVLVLLPGYGSGPESIFPETKLHNVAYANGILTIAVSTDRKLYADKSVTDGLNKILADVVTRYSVPKDVFVIGGYSAGGTLALRYTELCKQNPALFPIVPQGVFSVDGPVDLVDLYEYFNREIKRNFAKAGFDEAVMAKGIMDKELGPMKDSLAAYINQGPFYMNADKPGNEQYLKDVPVRVYHDVDVVWMLQNRHRSLQDMNATASSEMINMLIQEGNAKAEFVPGKTGYRSNGQRHPHSWSIVEEVDLIQWMNALLAAAAASAPRPYTFPANGWNVERAGIPLAFAPSIAYSGTDEIHFMPGFENAQTDNYFSYCFLWYLNGTVNFTEEDVKTDMKAYYNGLCKLNNGTTVTVTKTKPAPNFQQAFQFVIQTTDNLYTRKSITLNGTVNIAACNGGKNTVVFFEISPKDKKDGVWKELDAARDGVGWGK